MELTLCIVEANIVGELMLLEETKVANVASEFFTESEDGIETLVICESGGSVTDVEDVTDNGNTEENECDNVGCGVDEDEGEGEDGDKGDGENVVEEEEEEEDDKNETEDDDANVDKGEVEDKDDNDAKDEDDEAEETDDDKDESDDDGGTEDIDMVDEVSFGIKT